MSLKGSFLFFGSVVAPQAYAVVDQISVNKDGNAIAHVSVYGTPPVEKVVEQDVADNKGVISKVDVPVTERGSVVEHFSYNFNYQGGNIFGEAYAELKVQSDRVAGMVDA